MPDTKGHTLSDSAHWRSQEESDLYRQEVDGEGQGLGEGKGGVSVSWRQSFSLERQERSGDSCATM